LFLELGPNLVAHALEIVREEYSIELQLEFILFILVGNVAIVEGLAFIVSAVHKR
jgi:hypothetical protein